MNFVGLDRRRFILGTLTAVGAVTVASCGGQAATPTSESADDAVRSEVAAGEQALIDQYTATITAYPQLAASLTPIMQQHQAHLAAMTIAAPSAVAMASAPTPQAAVTALADAERAGALARGNSCRAATGADLARTLAFIAASEASHVPALREVRP